MSPTTASHSEQQLYLHAKNLFVLIVHCLFQITTNSLLVKLYRNLNEYVENKTRQLNYWITLFSYDNIVATIQDYYYYYYYSVK
jgi:hypothetical protein